MAARYLGVAPWELEKQPTWWRDRALIVKQAEQRADSILRKMHKQMQESQEYLS